MNTDPGTNDGASRTSDAEPTPEELRAFGRAWIEYLRDNVSGAADLEPDEEITYRRSDGSTLTFLLGNFAVVSPESIPPFIELNRLLEAGEDTNEHIAMIMEMLRYYRGH